MKIEKLKSGSYRVRMTKDKKTYSKIYPYQPTEREAYKDMIDIIEHPQSLYDQMTFAEAYSEYIKAKSNVLSPSTLRGYDSLFRNTDEKFKNLRLMDIDKHKLQIVINDYSKTHSAKSTKNLSAFYFAILGHFDCCRHISIDLPKQAPNEPYIPSQGDIKKLAEYFRGTDYEIAFCLLCMGLRRSEMLALTIDDVDKETNTILINKAKVLDADNNWVIKDYAKNEKSNRRIAIPEYVVNLIYEKKVIHDKEPSQIYKRLMTAEKKLGMPHFSLHKLRHAFISYAHSLGIPDADIMKMSGHSEQSTLDKIYRHSLGTTSANEMMVSTIQNLIQE